MTTLEPGAIAWTGGACPVDPEEVVKVWFKKPSADGFEYQTRIRQAKEFPTWEWSGGGWGADIVAYLPMGMM
jgi:hypothetical protein